MTRPGPSPQTAILAEHQQLDLAEAMDELQTMDDRAFVSTWPALVLDALLVDAWTSSSGSVANTPRCHDHPVNDSSFSRPCSAMTIWVPYGEVAKLLSVVAPRVRKIKETT